MLELVQKALSEYDRIFLITDKAARTGNDWKRFCNVVHSMNIESAGGDLCGKVFFYVEEGVEYSLAFPYEILLYKEAQELWDLYMTYEFSDRFLVFSDGKQFATVFNYVDTGILSEREAVMVILGYRKGFADGQIIL